MILLKKICATTGDPMREENPDEYGTRPAC